MAIFDYDLVTKRELNRLRAIEHAARGYVTVYDYDETQMGDAEWEVAVPEKFDKLKKALDYGG